MLLEALTALRFILPSLLFCCSFYNWTTHASTSNSSPNFEVVYDDPGGLLFRSKRDKKLLNVDPSVSLWLSFTKGKETVRSVHCGIRGSGVFDVTSQRLRSSLYTLGDS